MAKPIDHKSVVWVITDFETGGIDITKDNCALTEIGMIAIRADTLEEIGRYDALIKPYDDKLRYEDRAFEITGLSLAMLNKHGKEIAVVAKEVLNFLTEVNIFNSRGQHKPVIVGHNSPYEARCFQHLFAVTKLMKEFAKVVQGDEDYFGNFTPNYVDTLRISQLLFSGNHRITSFPLETTCEQLSINLPDGHRAMNDVIPTTEIMRTVTKLLRAAQSGTVVGSSETNQELNFRNGFQF